MSRPIIKKQRTSQWSIDPGVMFATPSAEPHRDLQMFSSVAFICTSSTPAWHSIGHQLLSQFCTFLKANVNRGLQTNDITAPFLSRRSDTDSDVHQGALNAPQERAGLTISALIPRVWGHLSYTSSVCLCGSSWCRVFISSVNVNMTFPARQLLPCPQIISLSQSMSNK